MHTCVDLVGEIAPPYSIGVHGIRVALQQDAQFPLCEILAHSHVGETALKLVLSDAAHAKGIIALQELCGAHLVLVHIVLNTKDDIALGAVLLRLIASIRKDGMYQLAPINGRQLGHLQVYQASREVCDYVLEIIIFFFTIYR